MNTKILVSLVVIGTAVAVAGGSTFALFNDTEASEGNTFTTGAVDLKIDWNKSYNGESLEDQPPTDNPMAIFNQSDVKPGDTGEATISFHIEDNPGYLWMRTNLTEDDDVSSTEPELEVDDPEDPNDNFDGELAGATEVSLWYDDGDNVKQADEEYIFEGDETCSSVSIDSALAFDRSGSMDGSASNPQPQKFENAKDGAKILFEERDLEQNDQAALVSFNQDATVEQELTQDEAALDSSVDGLTAQGNTDIAEAINTSRKELLNGSNARGNASKVLVVLSNGNQNIGDAQPQADLAKSQGIRVITIAYGDDADSQALEDLASSEDDAYNADQEDIDQVFQEISENVCAPGNLKNLDRALGSGILLDGDTSEEGTQPFEGETAQYIGFEWNVPMEVGNEIQTDSAKFDLEWYVEQARNNPNPQNPWAAS